MGKCPSCQAEVPDQALVCPNCSAPTSENLFEDDVIELDPIETEAPAPIAAPVPAPRTAIPVPADLELDITEPTTAPKPITRIVRKRTVPLERRPPDGLSANAKIAIGAGIALVIIVVVIRIATRSPAPPAPVVAAAEPVTAPAVNPSTDQVMKLLKMQKGGPSNALAFQQDLVDHENEDPMDSVERAMAHSGSDGSKELAAVEAKLEGDGDVAVEARAHAELDLLAAQNAKQVVSALENDAKRAPLSASVKEMLSEARATLNPKLAHFLVNAAPQNPEVYARALIGAGNPRAALNGLEALPDTNIAALRARIVTLSLIGQCAQTEELVTKLASAHPLTAIAPRLRYEAFCAGHLAEARSLASAALALEGLRPADRAWLSATAAILSLHADELEEAQRLVDQARELAPADPFVIEAAARVALAHNDVRTPHKFARVSDISRVALAIASLGDKKPQPIALPTYIPSAAMLRTIVALQRRASPVVALQNALDAALLGRWDGRAVIPDSAAELHALAKLGPSAHATMLHALADLLGDRPEKARDMVRNLKTPEARVLRLLCEWRIDHTFVAAHAPPAIEGKLRALANEHPPALKALLTNPVFAPYAAHVLALMHALPKNRLAALSARYPAHPEMLAAAATE